MPERHLFRQLARTVTIAVLFAFCLYPSAIAQHQRLSSNLLDPPINDVTGHVTENEVRDSVDLIAADIVSISFGASDHAGFDVFGSPVSFFPSNGNSFFVMSTGATASVTMGNNAEDTSTELGGLNTSEGEDMTQIVFNLQPPTNASCLAFDFAFYSEEFPEFVGSGFNDAFIAEIGQSTFQIVNNQVIAPNNFAFDTAGNVISVNTVFGVTAANAAGTTYDGATSLLTAKTPLEVPGDPITVTLSIMDLGDSIFDSTAFVDNFRWLFGVACEAGADVDNDRDSLLDGWETNGIDFDNDGTVDLDLPAMGADPNHKDVFIEIDYMVLDGAGGHSHKPKADALAIAIAMFANAPLTNPDGTTGIRLHIDAGSDTIMNPVTNATWGTRSKSDALTHQNTLGSATPTGRYNWSAFDTIKGTGTPGNFDVQRADVFHYCIFAHNLGPTFGSTSGISRGIPASDFIVSLGGWTGSVGTTNQQAGTLVHESGHNFGLLHGGDDGFGNYEPNYLSIMNYFFQMRGLRVGGSDGTFDYSRFALPILDETDLDETAGLMGVAEAAGYGTRFYDATATERLVNDVNGAIDWDQDGNDTETSVAVDVNGTGISKGTGLCSTSSEPCFVAAHCTPVGDTCLLLTTLDNTDNWDEFVFNGGAVGHLGEAIELPQETESIDITEEEDGEILTTLGVGLTGPGPVLIKDGKSVTYEYTITNTGINGETYAIGTMEEQAWADTSGVPATITLAPGESASFSIAVSVPKKTPDGVTDELVVTATSVTNPLITDSWENITTVAGPVTICHIPPGDPNAMHTIIVNVSAVPAHLAHGDFVGECSEVGIPAGSVVSERRNQGGNADLSAKDSEPTVGQPLWMPKFSATAGRRAGKLTAVSLDGASRSVTRHLRVFNHPGATEPARETSRDALLRILDQGFDPELRLEILGALVNKADDSVNSHLAGRLEVIRAEATLSGKSDLLKSAEDLLQRLHEIED